MQNLLLISALVLVCCSAAHAATFNIKNMEDRIAKKHFDENSQLRNDQLATASNQGTPPPVDITPVDIVSMMLNKPMLCCVLDLRVRVHLERILVAALESYEDGEQARAVRLLRLFIQRVEALECELDPCLERAVSRVMEIIRYLAKTNTAEGMEDMIKSGDELRLDGLLEAATVSYARAIQTEMVSMSLAEEQATFPKPATLELAPSALVPLPLPTGRPKPAQESYPERPQKDDEKPAPNDDEDEGGAMNEEEASRVDRELIREAFGWTLEDTEKHMRNQEKFGALMTDINGRFPQVLAGSAMARNPGEEATVWFKGPAPEEVLSMLEQFRADTEEMGVKLIDNMKFSMLEQEDRMDRLAMLLGERGYKGVGATMLPGDIIQITLPASEECPEVQNPIVGTSTNSATQTTTETFTSTEALLDFDGQPLVEIPHPGKIDPVAEKLLPESFDLYGIQIMCTSDEIDVDLHARGGRQVFGGGFQCTSGFSVYRISDGVTGIATAAHCTGMSTFDAESPEGDFSLYHRAEHCGSHGDVEWKTTNHVEPAEYWANTEESGDRRNVNSVESWYSNNNVYCVYSRMQGRRTCDRVYSHSTNQYGCWGVTAKRLVAMDHNRVIGGDSGGPWSYSTKAAGVTKGYKTIWFNKRDTFTKASRFDEALGVRIRTK